MSGGVAAHVVGLVEALPRDLFSVAVACPPQSQVWTRLSHVDGVRLHPIGADRRPAPGDLRTLAALVPLVRRADVVHVHSAKSGFLGRLAAAGTGRRHRCLFTPHAWSFWAASGAEASLYTGLERLAAHWCHAIVALSEAERDAALARGVGRPELFRVIPNGVHLARYAAGPEPVPGRVLFVGRLAAQKRFDRVLDAFAALGVPDAELHVVGDGPDRVALEELAGRLGIAAHVRFLGDRDDVPAQLAQASVLVLASDYEGCPLVVIEAMAAGVPVAATAVGGIGELIDDGSTGILTVPGDAAGLAAALRTLLTNPVRAREMGAAGRRVAAGRLSHEAMVSRLVSLYEEAAT